MDDENKLLSITEREKWDSIHQIFYQGQSWYRVVDIIDALEIGNDPADYWTTMKRRIKSEGFNETRQEIMQFELKSPKDKRLRKHDYAIRQTILRLIQSIPSPKVEECKIWLAEVGEQRLNQIAIDRQNAKLEEVRQEYRRQGRDERWIEDRILNLTGRNQLTDQGAIEHLHFEQLTSILHKGAPGVTPQEHKDIKQLPKREQVRDHMDQVELALLTLAEATATTKHVENDTQGTKGLRKDVRETSKTSEAIRKLTELGLGRPVVNPKNALKTTEQKHIGQLSLFNETQGGF